MTSNMILPVTGKLKDAMTAAHLRLKALEVSAYRLNDRKDYAPTAEVLDSLATELLHSTTGGFLTVRPTIGARFDMGPDTQLAKALDSTVGYLRNTATGFVTDEGTLPSYGGDETKKLITLLKTLSGLLTGSIMQMARNDLGKVRDQGPDALVSAANSVFDATHLGPKAG